MGKTYRRDQAFRPKKHGRVFIKDNKPWKKHKNPKHQEDKPLITSDDITQENFGL